MKGGVVDGREWSLTERVVRLRAIHPVVSHDHRDQWRALAAAKLGWMLDAMDFMLYAMAIGQLRTYFGFNDATAGHARHGHAGDVGRRRRASSATSPIASAARAR